VKKAFSEIDRVMQAFRADLRCVLPATQRRLHESVAVNKKRSNQKTRSYDCGLG
jgi:hypothetical protein